MRPAWYLVLSLTLALLLGALSQATPAQANTYVVTDAADAPLNLPSDTTCASTLPAHPFTLRVAFQAATNAAGVQTITVAVPGTYALTQHTFLYLSGVAIYLKNGTGGAAGFSVARVTPGQAVTVPLTVIDSCGECPTAVGGGPSAF
ncbi:MAG TPA: hypothetical protein VII06_37880 [Chloroflexota bacterium]|jgi:hypothetical protein